MSNELYALIEIGIIAICFTTYKIIKLILKNKKH